MGFWKFVFIVLIFVSIFVVFTNDSYQSGSVIINDKVTNLLSPAYDFYDGYFVSDTPTQADNNVSNSTNEVTV